MLQYQSRSLLAVPEDAEAFRIVALGGGTGLSTVLRGLRETDSVEGRALDLTAIVTVTDDGGSSGRLRRALGVAPPGDVRNCLVALSPEENRMAELFQYRFTNGHGLRGHSLGNLFLTALTQTVGNFPEAIRVAGRILNVRGRVFPSTVDDVSLRAVLADGRVVHGETAISHAGAAVQGIQLLSPSGNGRPKRVRALSLAVEALRQADLIVVGPGSLFTSLIPNLLVPDIRRAFLESRATKVFVMNLMTQPAETLGLSAGEHFQAVLRHLNLRGRRSKKTGKPSIPFDAVVLNRQPMPGRLLRKYARQAARPVVAEASWFQALGVKVLEGGLLAGGPVARHDPMRLAGLLCRLLPRG